MPGAGNGIHLKGTDLGETISGSALDDTIESRGGDDTLSGLGGDDLLIGGTGTDVSNGGPGNDWHFVDSAADQVIEASGEGDDRVFASTGYVLAAGVEVETLSTDWNAGTDPIALTGNELRQIIFGNAGDNLLSGGGGNDWLLGFGGADTTNGGPGDDWHFVDSAADQVIEASGEGNDRVLASVNYVLAPGVEVELLSTDWNDATDPIALTGNELRQVIFGNAGDNLLSGGGGNDWLLGFGGADTTDGGTGNDWHFVDRADDQVVEAPGEGDDRVLASVSYVLAAGVEVETLSTDWNDGTDPIALTGNAFGQVIYGNAGTNAILGEDGNDRIVGLGGADSLSGGPGDDELDAGEGDDTLSGGSGKNVMSGGAGNDTYHVTSSSDLVFDLSGSDRVFASVTLVLRDGSGIEILSTDSEFGTADIDLTGDAGNNDIIGNAGNNYLDGRGGNDRLWGLDGNDTLVGEELFGGNGDDVLSGGIQMDGGAGDDIYFANVNSRVVEAPGGGTDRVYVSSSSAGAQYTLPSGSEVEVLAAATQVGNQLFRLSGNEFSQLIYGSNGPNFIRGGGGNDTIFGLGGNDWIFIPAGLGHVIAVGGPGNDNYDVDAAEGDITIIENAGEGEDGVFVYRDFTLPPGIENIENFGSYGFVSPIPLVLVDNDFGHRIWGGPHNDVMDGKGGNDQLEGDLGDDDYLFTTVFGVAANNVDTLFFETGKDRILIDNAVFTGLVEGPLPAEAFRIGSAAVDADDRILFDPVSDALLFDEDGVGGMAAIQFAFVAFNLPVAATDFVVI